MRLVGDKRETAEASSAGAALARMRWSRKTKSQRSAVARELNAIRWGRVKAAAGSTTDGEASVTVGSQSGRSKRRKS